MDLLIMFFGITGLAIIIGVGTWHTYRAATGTPGIDEARAPHYSVGMTGWREL